MREGGGQASGWAVRREFAFFLSVLFFLQYFSSLQDGM